jgi:predicted nucleic acid-binding protein
MSYARKRVVFDTSSLIPACLNPDREPAKIFRRAVLEHDVFVSSDVHLLEMHPFRGVQILQLADFNQQILLKPQPNAQTG